MAYAIYTGDSALSGTETMFLLKERLKAGGWTVNASGGGADGWFSASSDGFNNTGSAGGGGGTLKAASTWFTITSPDGLRSFGIQKTNTSSLRSFRILYSSDGVGFVSGTANATVMPSASDGGQFVGSNGSTTNLFATDTTYFVNMMIGDSDEGYSFCLMTHPSNEGNAPNTLFGLDVLEDAMEGDPDPAVVFANFSQGFFEDRGLAFNPRNNTSIGMGVWGWALKGTEKQFFRRVPGLMFTSNDGSSIFNNLSPVGEALNSRFETFPLWYGSSYAGQTPAVATSQFAFYKGRSKMFRLLSTEAGANDDTSGNTHSNYPRKAIMQFGERRLIFEMASYPFDDSPIVK